MAPCADENANRNAAPEPAKAAEAAKPGAQAAADGATKAPKPALEPSLSAWAASRPSAAGPRNIGASERPAEEAAPELSVASRRSRSSAGSDRRLSSADIEEIRIQQKRGEVQALMRKNERMCREAIDNPKAVTNMPSSRSLNVTVPQEFNLSTSSRPRARSRSASCERRSGRSQSRGRAWKPQLTVARGPHLATGDRARSRSSSRHSTPASTPDRYRSLSRDSLLPPREALAVEGHNARMAVARSLGGSFHRHRTVSASPARSRVSASPARSCSDMSLCSASSRLSQLSRPRSLSRPHLTSLEIEQRQAAAGRQQLYEQLRQNERNLSKVLAQPEPPRPSSRELTVPLELELHTERRARSRSTSVRSCRSTSMESCSSERIVAPRERVAVAKHLERMTAAQVLDKAAPHAATSEKQQRWIREAPDAVERARRAKVVAKALRGDQEQEQRSRLCIFTQAQDLEDEDRELELAEATRGLAIADDDVGRGAAPESTPERCEEKDDKLGLVTAVPEGDVRAAGA